MCIWTLEKLVDIWKCQVTFRSIKTTSHEQMTPPTALRAYHHLCTRQSYCIPTYVCNWPPVVWGSKIPPHLNLFFLDIKKYISTTNSTLANYFRIPAYLLQPSGCPQTTNGLAPILKTQVLLFRQNNPFPHRNSVCLSQIILSVPVFQIATAPLQSKLHVHKYIRPWQSRILPKKYDFNQHA